MKTSTGNTALTAGTRQRGFAGDEQSWQLPIVVNSCNTWHPADEGLKLPIITTLAAMFIYSRSPGFENAWY